jgi:short-subunit dehydrogenase
MSRQLPQVKTRFTDNVVLVTGASSGIGAQTALAFARVGARVVMAARGEDKLRTLVQSHPDLQHRLIPLKTDITKDADVQRLFAEIQSRFGRLDILVNNAGSGLRALLVETQLDDARRLMELNLFGALRCIKAALPLMKRQRSGQIVNIGSVLSVVATPRNAIYCASKFALRGLTDSLRMELRDTGVDVISVLPGYTDTEFFDHMVRYGGPARVTSIKGQSPAVVARVILRACQRRQREVALTAPGIFGYWMKRFAPALLELGLRTEIYADASNASAKT